MKCKATKWLDCDMTLVPTSSELLIGLKKREEDARNIEAWKCFVSIFLDKMSCQLICKYDFECFNDKPENA